MVDAFSAVICPVAVPSLSDISLGCVGIRLNGLFFSLNVCHVATCVVLVPVEAVGTEHL